VAAIGYLLDLVSLAIQVYIYIIVARALISWVSPDPYNPVVRFLYRATEPVLRPVREMLPISRMGIDFSPMIVILGLILLMRVIPWIYGGV